MICLIALLALNQEPPSAHVPVLALTPKLDGRIETEEWQAFDAQGGNAAFFQWEPGRLFAAAKLPTGKSFVLSLDMKANGWLVGDDNLELHVRWAGDRPECKIRRLDATGASGPVWQEAPAYQESVVCAATSSPEGWTVELGLEDPGLSALPEGPDSRLGVRVDFAAAEPEAQPFLPRTVQPVRLVFEHGTTVPEGLRWKPQYVNRGVAPGSRFRIRMTFNGSNDLALHRIEMRSEGLAAEDTLKTELPFPRFDNKGRTFVDYNTPVAPNASEGYRIMRTTVRDAQGRSAVLRTSYFVAPAVVLDLGSPTRIRASDEAQKVRMTVYARSNLNRRIEGTLRLQGPAAWKVEAQDDRPLTIGTPYGSARRQFDVTIPAGAKGGFPIRIQADLGGRSYARTVWVTLG